MLKVLKFFVFLIFSFIILFIGFMGGFNFRGLIARIYDHYKLYLWDKEYEKKPWVVDAKNDFWGGTTPQKTWELFLKTFKENKIDEAANYFYISEKDFERKKEILENTKKWLESKKDVILNFPEKILVYRDMGMLDFQLAGTSAFKMNGRLYSLDISFQKNLWTGIWKINHFVYSDQDVSNEEVFNFFYKDKLEFLDWAEKNGGKILSQEEKEKRAREWALQQLKEHIKGRELTKEIYRKIYNQEP
jgi:hypothetical protein